MISVTRHEKSGGGTDMAKQAADLYTLDLLNKPKRGRPRKPDAKTPAQRAREYRARKRVAASYEGIIALADKCPDFDADAARLVASVQVTS